MKRDTTIIRKYADAKPELKIDIICRYYPQLDNIIDAGIAGIKFIICEERARNQRAEYGELGVRVQSGRDYSDPTADEGDFHADLENAIRKCDFSGNLLDGIEQADRIIEEAHILWEMKEIRDLYDLQIACLRATDRVLYQRYLNQEMTISDIASEYQIEYHSAAKKISRIRKCVQNGVIETIKFTSCQHGTK